MGLGFVGCFFDKFYKRRKHKVIQKMFGVSKPIIGMLHLKKQHTITKAKEDIRALQKGGVDGICIENWEVKSAGPFLSTDEASGLRRIIGIIRDEITVPVGINVLHNDYRTAFSLASEFNLKFVWLDVFVDLVRTDFKYSKILPFDIIVDTEDVRKYKALSGNIPLLVQVHPKHYKPINEQGQEISEEKRPLIEIQARRAIENGADAIVITKSTGFAPDPKIISRVKNYIGRHPVLVGSGVSLKNIEDFLVIADGMIIGTSLKTKNFDRVIEAKVECLMNKVNELRR